MLENEKTIPGARRAFLHTFIRPVADQIKIYDAFFEVDRGKFAPKGTDFSHIYSSRIIEISKDSTMSDPSLMCEMIKLLNLQGTEKVLEVGTASGYNAALLSKLASEVHTIEYDPELAAKAGETLKNEGYENVHVYLGDGALGLPDEAPFDAIIVTAGARKIPKALIRQLSNGGKIVIPVGGNYYDCDLIVATKRDKTLSTEKVYKVSFVPLFSKERGGWTKGKSERRRLLQRGKNRLMSI